MRVFIAVRTENKELIEEVLEYEYTTKNGVLAELNALMHEHDFFIVGHHLIRSSSVTYIEVQEIKI